MLEGHSPIQEVPASCLLHASQRQVTTPGIGRTLRPTQLRRIRGGTRTRKPGGVAAFKAAVSAVPPHGLDLLRNPCGVIARTFSAAEWASLTLSYIVVHHYAY